MICTLPRAGWRCTREAGHVGPCAALPVPERLQIASELAEKGVRESVWLALYFAQQLAADGLVDRLTAIWQELTRAQSDRKGPQ